ncbi:helix-turn-helix domain-containing protein [Aquitalea sp. ASV11]|uniref:helix-turn-helix domain-containing protein n=1 Tax=Aquitalea sp. ASV11 TaxID=2795103 RepID=UPI0018EC7DE0|nr:helix-turn-helix transcriptional regulator [Aquitalea sp. ASV11]
MLGFEQITKPMSLRDGLAHSLRTARRAKGVSQEALDTVSSRTYVSALERGLKNPTIEKLDEIASAIDMHLLALLTFAYVRSGKHANVSTLLKEIEEQVQLLIENEESLSSPKATPSLKK